MLSRKAQACVVHPSHLNGSDTDVLLDKTVQQDGRRHVKILAKPFATQDLVDLLT